MAGFVAMFTLGRRICNFRAFSAGVVAVVTAMVLPLLLGFTSLGVEVGHWYLGAARDARSR
jgi:Flp pilus assembly protein TadG